ncbi:MAG: hypothetical protein RR624_01225 [Longicatena sp.]
MKIGIVSMYVDLFYRIIKSKKIDKTIPIALNLIPTAEVSFVLAMSCISVTMTYSVSSAYFVLPFVFVNIVLLYIESIRVLFVGKKSIFIRKKTIPLKQIINIESNLLFMTFYTTKKTYKIWMPITKFEYLNKNLLEGYTHKNIKRKQKRKLS